MQINKSNERISKRHHPKMSEKIMTDQSFKNSSNINTIVKQLTKTGVMPQPTKIPQYGDYSEMPTLETAFAVAKNAANAFYALPSDIRKLIDNDPSQLENFVANDDNKDLCIKYGLGTKPAPVDTTPPKVETTNVTTTKTEE